MIRSCVVGFLGVVGLSCLTIPALEHSPLVAHAQLNTSIASDVGAKRAEYVGDAACLSCHKEQSLSYRHTSHHLTSQPADKDSILGTFAEGSNILMISNPENATLDPRLYFQMEAKGGGFYQTAVAERGSERLVRSEGVGN